MASIKRRPRLNAGGYGVVTILNDMPQIDPGGLTADGVGTKNVKILEANPRHAYTKQTVSLVCDTKTVKS